MKLCIVPMKPLARAKARLAEVLSPEDRRRLSLAMLEDVVIAARALDEVWVLNSDDDAADVAARLGAEPKPDPTPDEGLNASLKAATADAAVAGAHGVLVLSADLAAVRGNDVRAMALGTGVVLAPDRTARGTNALWRMPPDAIPAMFGVDSRRAHEAFARAHRIPFAIVARPALALDIDSPRDMADVRSLGPGEATRAVLDDLGYPAGRVGR